MEEKKDVGHLFDRIAGTYDKFNHLLSLNIDKRWRRKAIRGLSPARDLLDVAIGTGDLSIEAMRQHKAMNITGIDLSVEMMKIGREKARKAALADAITFEEGSALEMPYSDSSFDTVTCAYGVRNFSDLDKGLTEMHRVLRAGGQLMILEFSYPGNPVIRAIYDFFFTRIMPVVGKMISKDPSAYVYFCKSVKGFIWGDEMAARIKAAGFSEVSYETLTFGITTIYRATK
jgi:ubiquinone/menaquinone biosynthesis methyltransferases